MEGAAGKSKTIHCDGRDGIVSDLELDAGVDGTALIFRNRKDGAGDQLLQRVLGDFDGTAGVDVGQVRVILGALGRNGEGCIACPDGDLVIVVNHNGDRTFGELTDDIAKELGRQDAGTGIGNVCFHAVSDGGFHIVAGEGQVIACVAEDTLDNAEGTLLGDCSACNIQALNQHAFFTGKAHISFPFLKNIIDISINK